MKNFYNIHTVDMVKDLKKIEGLNNKLNDKNTRNNYYDYEKMLLKGLYNKYLWIDYIYGVFCLNAEEIIFKGTLANDILKGIDESREVITPYLLIPESIENGKVKGSFYELSITELSMKIESIEQDPETVFVYYEDGIQLKTRFDLFDKYYAESLLDIYDNYTVKYVSDGSDILLSKLNNLFNDIKENTISTKSDDYLKNYDGFIKSIDNFIKRDNSIKETLSNEYIKLLEKLNKNNTDNIYENKSYDFNYDDEQDFER